MKNNQKKVIIVLVLFLILSVFGGRVYQVLAVGRNGFQTFLQVLETIKTQYVKKDPDETKLFYGAIKGLLFSLNDPYTRFLEPKAFSEMKIRMKGSFGGIGIQIGMKNDILTVISPLENTPAWKAGLLSLDQILAIDGEPTFDISMEEAVQKIRGARGTKVKLRVMRKSFKKPKDFEILRDIIAIEDLKYTMLDKSVGYVKLMTFENEKTYLDLRRALTDLQSRGMKSLIIDVRNNGGGLLQNALDISGLLLEKGKPIVSTVDREGKKETHYTEGGYLGRLPLVILVNEASASASEILAGAVQDNHVGKVIGRNTFGKASVQTVKTLWDGSALLYTVAKYLTPSGRDITEKGIAPDILVKEKPRDNGDSELTDEISIPVWPPVADKDTVLKKALEFLGGAAVPAVAKQKAFLDTISCLPYINFTFSKNC